MARKALAVKYRPKTFKDVCSQEAITTILEEQIRTKTFQHSYLFCGPAGCGKTTAARIFGNDINGGTGSIIEIDAASNNGVENVRGIIESAKQKSLDSEYKVYILDEVHMMSTGAWNAMLKILEEPPKYAIFIMATTDPQKIPATIISRVQRYNFSKIPTDIIEERLTYILREEKRGFVYEPDAIKFIAKLSNGGMRDAITMLDKCLSLNDNLTVEGAAKILGASDYNAQLSLLDYLIMKEASGAIELVENEYRAGRDLKNFINSFVNLVTDCCKFKLFNSFDYLQIPPILEVETKLQEYDSQDLLDILDFVLLIQSTIKWDSNPLYVIQAMILARR